MEQLSGIDSYFLYTERGNVYNHVASLAIYDPSTAPSGKVRYRDILRHFGAKLATNPVFRRRLVSVPHELDRPYWVDDPDLDLEFHVRHIALPQPGDWRQLMIQVARLHSRPLDRTRPLWEVYVIEGLDRIPDLPPRCFALFVKFHHASLDGEAGAQLLRAVHSLTPEASEGDGGDAGGDAGIVDRDLPVLYAEREPTSVELYTRAVTHGAGRFLGAAGLYVSTLGRLGNVAVGELQQLLRRTARLGEAPGLLPGFVRAPLTRFNRRVSANRVVEAVAFPVARLQAARRRVGDATINDLFLAIVGGALRRYLLSKDELPSASLMALMPISTRGEGASSRGRSGRGEGNQVGGVPVPLGTGIADPIDRLAAVHAGTQSGKRDVELLGPGFVQSIVDDLPHAAAELLVRNFVYPQLNVTVSNIRGPEATLYVAGARLVHFYPVSIATDYVGLNHTGFSYNGALWISAVACRNMLPDPGFYADCLRASFEQLMTAIEALPEQKATMNALPGAVARKRAPRRAKGKAVAGKRTRSA